MSIVKQLHKVKLLRQVAKTVAKKITLKQPFYNGVICLNAVEHSWAWTGKNSYETFDKSLQNALYQASFTHDLLVDIGCNIGVITVGTLLHNPTIKSIAVDPNSMANQLLKQTLLLNKLADRCHIISAVVGTTNGIIKFDETGSVTGHVAPDGKITKQIKLAELLNQNHLKKTLVKIDVEGYETILLTDFKNIKNIHCYTFFIEVHEAGFNEAGNPEYVFSALKEMNATITDLAGTKITALQPNIITQIIVKFYAN
ncbi:MAG: FkbM family methyltransferase [Janthinobacterium lividum]